MNNILVVNVNWLGDAVFSTPIFKNLKQAYPQARITCLCVPRVKEVLDYCPYVDRIIVYDEKGKHAYPWRKWRLIGYLRKERFDAAFILHRSITRSLMVFLAGIPIRVGYGKLKGLLTHPVSMKQEDIHRSDYYLKVLEGYGIKIKDRSCELRLKIDDIHAVENKLKKAKINPEDKFIVLNTGGNWDLKRWNTDSFAILAKRLVQEQGLKIVFTGSPKDRENIQSIICRDAIYGVLLTNLAGETTLGESLVIYKKAMAVISADSGPLHLAHSVGADVIAIFGPTRPEITGPRGTGRAQVLFKEIGCNKAPCYLLSCNNNLCMQSVTVEDVCQAIKKF